MSAGSRFALSQLTYDLRMAAVTLETVGKEHAVSDPELAKWVAEKARELRAKADEVAKRLFYNGDWATPVISGEPRTAWGSG
jgi:hypothetical protein